MIEKFYHTLLNMTLSIQLSMSLLFVVLILLGYYLIKKRPGTSKKPGETKYRSRNPLPGLSANDDDEMDSSASIVQDKELAGKRDKVVFNLPGKQQKKKKIEKGKILIANTSPLKSRILARVVESLDLKSTIFNHSSTLEREVLSGDYDILISDLELLPDDLNKIEKRVAILAISDIRNSPKLFSVLRGELMPHTLSKKSLRALINKYKQGYSPPHYTPDSNEGDNI